eukprot:748852-Hanusia_phi.AAC.1
MAPTTPESGGSDRLQTSYWRCAAVRGRRTVSTSNAIPSSEKWCAVLEPPPPPPPQVSSTQDQDGEEDEQGEGRRGRGSAKFSASAPAG